MIGLEICILAACAGIWPRAELSTPLGENIITYTSSSAAAWKMIWTLHLTGVYIYFDANANFNGTDTHFCSSRRRQVCALEITTIEACWSLVGASFASAFTFVLIQWSKTASTMGQDGLQLIRIVLILGPSATLARNWCSNCSSIRRVPRLGELKNKTPGVYFAINEQRENESSSA